MIKNFEINKKTYLAKEFDYNMICDLQDLGVDIADFDKKPTSSLRAYFAICSGLSLEDAGKEISQHIINKGKLDDLSNAMIEGLSESDFFQAITQEEKEETPKSTSKKKS